MHLLEKKTGNILLSRIDKISTSDYEWIAKSPEFRFDWNLEKNNEVYKIVLEEKEHEPLGLISLIDYPEEYRIHLNLIEVGLINRGRNKQIENITGCLIAYACKLAFNRDYFGFVSLQPKTALIDLYQNRYGFRQYGRLLAVQLNSSMYLIKKYLSDEEE